MSDGPIRLSDIILRLNVFSAEAVVKATMALAKSGTVTLTDELLFKVAF